MSDGEERADTLADLFATRSSGPSPDRPTIMVDHAAGVAEERLREVLWGIEEEGIPYVVRENPMTGARELAHEAALASRLGVGVGVSQTDVVVTTEKLPVGDPYITEQLNLRRASDRAIGANAARIVKRMPLRDPRSEA